MTTRHVDANGNVTYSEENELYVGQDLYLGQDDLYVGGDDWRYIKIEKKKFGRKYFEGKLLRDNQLVVPHNPRHKQQLKTPLGIFEWRPERPAPISFGWIPMGILPPKPEPPIHEPTPQSSGLQSQINVLTKRVLRLEQVVRNLKRK